MVSGVSSAHKCRGAEATKNRYLSAVTEYKRTEYKRFSVLVDRTLQLYIHSDKPSKLICSPHLSHNLSYIICILSQRNMFLTMLVDLVVFRLYITLICSFLHYITLNTTLRVTSALQHSATWQFHESDWQDTEEEVSLCLDRCCGTHYH